MVVGFAVGGVGVGARRSEAVRVRPRRRTNVVVNHAVNNGDAGTPKLRRDVGLHESWYIYYEEGNKCVVCRGHGYETCSYCGGDGYVVIGADPEQDKAECPLCAGTGKLICMRCHGTGERPDTVYNVLTDSFERNKTNAEVLADARKDAFYTANQPEEAEKDGEVKEKVEKDSEVKEKVDSTT